MSCHCQDEIIRDGSSQLSRYLQALDPSYAPIDDRSIEELLVYAKRYASQIRYYEPPDSDLNLPEKTSWREFFRRDLAVIAASMAVTDLYQIKKDYDETSARLAMDPKQSLFAALFNPVIGILVKVDKWFSIAIPGNPLYEDLTLGIDSTLKGQVKKIRAYEEGFRLVVDPAHPLDLNLADKINPTRWDLDGPTVADISIYQGSDEAARIRHAALFVDDLFLTCYGFLQNLVNISPGYITYALEMYPAHQPHMGLFIAFLKLFRLAQNHINSLPTRMLDFYYRDVLQLKEKPAVPDRVHIVFELAKDVAEYDVVEQTSLDGGKDKAGNDLVYKTETDLVVNQAKVKELKTIHLQKNSTAQNSILKYIDAKPVANSQDGYGEKFTDPHPMWPTFGKPKPSLAGTAENICKQLELVKELLVEKNEAQVGFALASPQLLLQSGNRLVAFTIPGLSSLIRAENVKNISLMFTSEKEWLTLKTVMTAEAYQYLIKVMQTGNFNEQANLLPSGPSYFVDLQENIIWVYFPVEAEAIVPFDSKIHDGSFVTSHPVMQVVMGPDLGLDLTEFAKTKFTEIEVEVRVGTIPPAASNITKSFDGLKKLLLKNDQGNIDTATFDPFTPYVTPGGNFYIGGSEIFNKPIDALALNLDFYNGSSIGDSLTVSYLDRKAWSLLDSQLNFSNLTRNFLVRADGTAVILERKPLVGNAPLDQSSVRGFIRMQYFPDYGEFAPSASEAMQLYRNTAIEIQTKDISVSYHSKLERLESGYDQFFHIYPFGCAEITAPDDSRSNTGSPSSAADAVRKSFQIPDRGKDGLWVTAEQLFPQFTYTSPYSQYRDDNRPIIKNSDRLYGIDGRRPGYDRKKSELSQLLYNGYDMYERMGMYANQYSGLEQEEGMLFIGLENLKPLQTLSLLFQFAEGTAEDEDNDPPEIHWSYLAHNEWRPLKGESILSDGTYGFQTTGIIKFDIPKDITDYNTIITTGLHWLCASVTKDSHRIPRMIDVVAQAVVASLEDHQNDPSHFDEALPAGTVGKLTTGVAAISKVIQPFESWGAKHAEVGKEFYARVSERLRHKNRAVNARDYEHIILDKFPSLYKIKAIPHTDPNCLCRHPEPAYEGEGYEDCCGPQTAPGHILLVPISNLKNRVSLNPLQPKTGRRTLREIEQFVSSLKDPFVQVHARNPLYEQVIVFFRVKFREGVDKGYYLKKLNDEIVHFLTPWAFDDTAEITFGAKIYSSSIVNFIEERPYVDFITDFLMGVCLDQCCPATLQLPADDQTVDGTVKTVVQGTVLDRITGSPMKHVAVRFNAGETITTADNGTFTVTPVGPIAQIQFSHPGYHTKDVRIPIGKVVTVMMDFDTDRFNVCRKSDDNPATLLSDISNCDDIEELLQRADGFRGDVVAKPSTSRSILVSAARHIIIPYEEKPVPTPCELRAMRVGQPSNTTVPQPAQPEAEQPAAPAAPPATEKSGLVKSRVVESNEKTKKVVRTTKKPRKPKKPDA